MVDKSDNINVTIKLDPTTERLMGDSERDAQTASQ